jgi:hypothetical protein
MLTNEMLHMPALVIVQAVAVQAHSRGVEPAQELR